jgi:hypothetical protein
MAHSSATPSGGSPRLRAFFLSQYSPLYATRRPRALFSRVYALVQGGSAISGEQCGFRETMAGSCAGHCWDDGVGVVAVVAVVFPHPCPFLLVDNTCAVCDARLSQNPASGQDSSARFSGQRALCQPLSATNRRIRPKARAARPEAKHQSVRSRKHHCRLQ